MFKHPYHLVDISPWPIFLSFSLLSLGFTIIKWLTGIAGQNFDGYHKTF